MTGCARKRAAINKIDPFKEATMDVYYEILRSLGRIEGELIEIRKLSVRVSALEQMQSWLKGGWAILLCAITYLFRGSYAK
jgi:hypothetical protein